MKILYIFCKIKKKNDFFFVLNCEKLWRRFFILTIYFKLADLCLIEYDAYFLNNKTIAYTGNTVRELLSKLKNFVKNRTCFVKNRFFLRNQFFSQKNELFCEKQIFCQKLNFLDKNLTFCQKSIFFFKSRNFLSKIQFCFSKVEIF